MTYCDYFIFYVDIRKGFVKFSKPVTTWLHRMIGDRAKIKQIFFFLILKAWKPTNKKPKQNQNKIKQNDNHNFRIILEYRKGYSMFRDWEHEQLVFCMSHTEKHPQRITNNLFQKGKKSYKVSYRKRHKYPLMERCN